MLRKKLVVVGDGACGKTTLLIKFSTGQFVEEFIPTVLESRLVDFKVDGMPTEVVVWDTSGQEDYEPILLATYPNTDVVLICFSVDQHESLENVKEKWIPEVLHFCSNPRIPYFLIGCKTDLRFNSNTLRWMAELGLKPLTPEQGQDMAQQIGAQMYLECSAKAGDNVDEVFEHAVRATLLKPGKSKGCVVL